MPYTWPLKLPGCCRASTKASSVSSTRVCAEAVEGADGVERVEWSLLDYLPRPMGFFQHAKSTQFK